MSSTATTEKKAPVTGRKKRKIFRCFIAAVLVLLAAVAIFSIASPLPVAYVLKIAFRNGNAVAPEDYELLQIRTFAATNLKYPSKYESNTADIYYPSKKVGPYPVILWIHGGAYVGGDKKDLSIYATSLAAEGYAVVCMNYQLAPGAKYPTPVIQTGEAYEWLCDIAEEYSLDMERFVLAGDSAGAHIAAQFAAIQSNEVYAAEMGIEPVVIPETLKAAVLYCGPFDSVKISAVDNRILSFLLSRAAWAYFGERSWEEPFAHQASIAEHITADFPPAFISDGNTASFEDHARGFVEVLSDNGVSVETYFINKEVETTYHEYQFVMNTPAGREAFQKTLEFLDKYVR